METERADVVVLGLGPAGASAAAEAARRGCRVIALDRKREPGQPVQCAEFVPMMVGMEVVDLAGAVCQRIDSMRTFVEEDEPDITQNFPGQMIDRAEFDAALVAKAAQAGVQCRFSSSVRRIARTGCVEISEDRAVQAPVIIGADGPRSLAGKAIGRVNRELVETRQITVELRKPHAATDIFLSAAIPGGYGWLFPKRDRANLGAGVSQPHKERLKEIVSSMHARLAAQGRVGGDIIGFTGGAIPVGGMLMPWGWVGDALVLLAGDAAGLTNPVTGAGIAAAVISGRVAGEAAAAHAGGDGRAASLYQDELECLFKAALDRAARRRAQLAALPKPNRGALRRGWIAYPEYWQ